MELKHIEEYKHYISLEQDIDEGDNLIKIDKEFIDLVLSGKDSYEDFKKFEIQFSDYLDILVNQIPPHYQNKAHVSVVKYLESINSAITNVILYKFHIDFKLKNSEKYLIRKNISKNKLLLSYIMNIDYISKSNLFDALCSLHEKLNTMESKLCAKINLLKTELDFRPGGKGMLEAKASFESIAKK